MPASCTGIPEVEIASVTGRSAAGKRLGEVYPHLDGLGLTLTPDLTGSVDVVFSALPHAASAERLGPLVEQGVKALDLSADFRLKDLSVYEEWYKVAHPCPQYIEDAVYGLTELHRTEVASASLVAVPGCYPTASVLGLARRSRRGL